MAPRIIFAQSQDTTVKKAAKVLPIEKLYLFLRRISYCI